MRLIHVSIALLVGVMAFAGVNGNVSAMQLPASHIGTAGHTKAVVTDTYYDILALGYYCENGGTSCYDNCVTVGNPDPAFCPGLDFGAVEAVGNDPGVNSETPAEIAVMCGRTTATGVTETWLDVYDEGPNSQAPGVSDGVLTGQAALLTPNVDETVPVSESSIHVSGFAPNFSNASTTVYGVQNTDNADHDQNNGGFNITIRGVLDQINNNSHHYLGTMSCLAGGRATRALQNELGCNGADDYNQAFGFEGAMEENAGDEYHTYNQLGPFDPPQGFDNFLENPGGLYQCEAYK